MRLDIFALAANSVKISSHKFYKKDTLAYAFTALQKASKEKTVNKPIIAPTKSVTPSKPQKRYSR